MSDALDPDHPLAQLLAEQQVKADAHTALRETVPYKAAMCRIDKLVLDYELAINAIDLMATRWPPYFDRLITLRLRPQPVEATVAASYFLRRDCSIQPDANSAS